MTFADWLAEVAGIVIERTGIDLDALPDWLYRDAFDNGFTPDEAADELLRVNGYPD